MKILFVCDSEEHGGIMLNLVIQYRKYEIVLANSLVKVKEAITLDGPFAVIFVYVGVRDFEPVAVKEMTDELLGHRPYVFFGTKSFMIDRKILENYEYKPYMSFIEPDYHASKLQPVMQKNLEWYHDHFGEVSIKRPDEEMIPMRIRGFFLTSMIEYDAYLKMGEGSYLKIIYKNEKYSDSMLVDYVRGGHKYFYLGKDGFIAHMEKTITTSFEYLKSGQGPVKEKLNLQICIAGLLHEYIRNIGVTEDLMMYVERMIKFVQVLIDGGTRFTKVFNCFPYKGDAIPEQTVLSLYLASLVCRYEDHQSDLAYRKLALGSLLRDCFLTDDSLAEIRFVTENVIDSLQPEQIEMVKSHIDKAAVIADSFVGYSEVRFIIEQHHAWTEREKSYPIYFPTRKMPTLSSNFIVITQFATILSKHGGQKDLVLKDLYDLLKATNNKAFQEVISTFINFYGTRAAA